MPSTTFFNLPEEKRERLLAAVRLTEHDPSLLGLSPHFLCVAAK